MDLERLKQVVFAKQRTLGAIYHAHGSATLADYAGTWRIEPVQVEGFEALLLVLQDLSLKLFGQEVAGQLAASLKARPLVSTIDHHGIFGHPFFLNSNLVYSFYPKISNLVCLATAGVSLNNTTSWSGCLLVTGSDGVLHRWSFFPDKLKTRSVLSTPVFTSADVERVVGRIGESDFLPARDREKLSEFVHDTFNQADILGLPDFSSQASVVSRRLWRAVFPQAPGLVYLSLEQVVTEFISRYIAARPDHILHRLLFTPAGWESIERHFQGSLGAFTSAHKGSFLFWGIGSKGRRIHLVRQGNTLVGQELAIPADAETIIAHLQSGRLYPTSLVGFLVLLYCGMTCLGGFNQVNWLSDIRVKFVELLTEWGEGQAAARIKNLATDNFAEAGLAFAVNRQGQIYKPTALDLYLSRPQAYQEYRQLAGQLTVRQGIEVQLPEIYRVITPAPERDQALMDIREADILAASGVETIIRRA
jgi:hypothetical protein